MKLLAALGLLGVVAIVIGAVVVKRRFEEYANKSKTTEARSMVRRILARAVQFADGCPSPAATTAQVACLPPAAPVTPALGACCAGGKGCQPVEGDFEHPGWEALNLAAGDGGPFRYSYELRSGGGSFTAFAYGDLDCDGVYSTYSMGARLAPDGQVTLDSDLIIVNAEE